MLHSNDDNDDDGDVHECDDVHASEPLFCPHQHHTNVPVQSTLLLAAWQGHDLCLYDDGAYDNGTLNQGHAQASSQVEIVHVCAVTLCDALWVTLSPFPVDQMTLTSNVQSWHCPNAVV